LPVSDHEPPIGLIAGEGRLPVLTAQGIRAAGRRVACVGLWGQYDDDLPGACDDFRTVGLVRMGKWVRVLRGWGVSDTVMVGRVKKSRMYDPLRWFRQIPDWRAIRLWYRTLRHDKRNQALLTAVADELARGGVQLIDSTQYIPDHLAADGVMTRTLPSPEAQADIDFARPLVAQLGALDIGQSIAVKEREVVAVEAIEGTDAMIERAGQLCRMGQWTLIKTAGPHKDMRFDVPVVGVQTIEKLKANHATCLVVEAGKVILIDKPKVLAAADQAGIAIVGVTV